MLLIQGISNFVEIIKEHNQNILYICVIQTVFLIQSKENELMSGIW